MPKAVSPGGNRSGMTYGIVAYWHLADLTTVFADVRFRCCGRLPHRHGSAMDVGAVRPHDSEEPSHASDYDHRSRHCEVGFPGSRRRCEGRCGASPPDQAALRSGVLPEPATVPGRHRSLCLGAPLVAPTASAWPHRSPDAAALRDALCEAA